MAPRKSKELPLSRERVCAEALALVDEEGLDALSMRRLGARLGVEAMSLYRHVRDKADLLDALHAAVLGGLEPDFFARGWRALLGGLARALRGALLRHPQVAPLFTRRPLRAPEAIATVERVRAAMSDAGFDGSAIAEAIYVVGMFTIGHVLFEINGTRSGDSWEIDSHRQGTFRFGLEALLDGIDRQRRRSKRKKKP